MKSAKDYIINILIVLFSLLFVGISFANFYKITTTGSALDNITGEFVQSVKKVNNSYLSIICTFLPLICIFLKKKWANILSIYISILNLMTIVFVYPLLISSIRSMIGSSYSVKLTGLGWIGMFLILLITFLLVIDMICKRKAYIGDQKGGTNE